MTATWEEVVDQLSTETIFEREHVEAAVELAKGSAVYRRIGDDGRTVAAVLIEAEGPT